MLPLNDGWPLLDGLVADAARHRARLEAWWETNLPAGQVVAPIVIAGAYRTGTTFLHRALAAAMPERRTLLGWEATIPTPPPARTLTDRVLDPRCGEQQAVVDVLFDAVPELRELHDEPAYAPAECVQVMAQTGLTGLWPAICRCPEYRNWLLSTDAQADADAAYTYFDACLRTLDPDAAWLLKAPMHSLFLPALLERWPDAIIVRVRRPRLPAERSAIRFFTALRELSQPDRRDIHAAEVASWVGPYLAEHDRRVDVAAADGVHVVDVDETDLRLTAPTVIHDLVGRCRAAHVHA